MLPLFSPTSQSDSTAIPRRSIPARAPRAPQCGSPTDQRPNSPIPPRVPRDPQCGSPTYQYTNSPTRRSRPRAKRATPCGSPTYQNTNLLILLLIYLPAFLPAQRQAQVYTGQEAPLCFDTNLFHDRAIDPYPILQFLGARCAETTKLTATRGLFRFKGAHPHYPEYQRLPLDIYFQPADAPLEEIYHLSTGNAALHITLPMRYEGTYYVVIRDQIKPSVLIVNSVTLAAEFRRCCALTESIIPEYLYRH